jgi:hypothetical protein
MSGRRRTLLAILTLLTVGLLTSSASAARTAGGPPDVSQKRGVPSCVSSHLLAARHAGTRSRIACQPQCWYLDGQLVCGCKLRLTINCSVLCTIKCSRNRTRYTVGYAHTVADDRLKGLRKCLKTAERNARVGAFISYRSCRVTECRPLTGLAKPAVARAVYFTMPGEAPTVS